MREAVRRQLQARTQRVVAKGRWLLASERERRVIEWVSAGFDKSLRLDYDLGEDSVVLDLGGHAGDWSSDIFARFCCNVHVFEPASEFARHLRQRFARNPRIHVYEFGLAAETRDAELILRGPGSTLFGDLAASPHQRIRLIRAADFFESSDITFVDLMKVNIEGGEYELLDHLITEGLVARIGNIQVQFHDVVPNSTERMQAIQAELRKTHALTFQMQLVWENWALRPDT